MTLIPTANRADYRGKNEATIFEQASLLVQTICSDASAPGARGNAMHLISAGMEGVLGWAAAEITNDRNKPYPLRALDRLKEAATAPPTAITSGSITEAEWLEL